MANQMVFKRYEFKYLITRSQQNCLFAAMEPYMNLDEYGHSSIRNIYFDTPDFRLARRSLESPIYKEKLRVRSYGRAQAGDKVFIELKKKYKSVVYKRRLALLQEQATTCLYGGGALPDTQIGGEIAYVLNYYQTLQPAVFLSYERHALHAKDESDFRVTFDENILYRQEALSLNSDAFGEALLRPDQVLMELKIDGGLPLWMVRALSDQKIFKTSFSKYGAAYQNLFLKDVKGVYKYA